MIEFPFGTDAISKIIEYRSDTINHFFQFVSYMGEVEGYILVITCIYIMYDKKLAYRLAVLTLTSMALNHLLKSIIAMPRPFVKEGTYIENWLVSSENAHELVSEFSTPSGHAMSSSTFYGYLLAMSKNRYIQAGLFFIIILVGFSRPYLAVHFVEDILLGWLFGFLLIWGIIKTGKPISEYWRSIKQWKQLLIIVCGSLGVWLITFFINGGNIASQPLPFVGYLGFLLGVTVGEQLEQKFLNFDPKSKSIGIKISRWLFTVALVMVPVIFLDGIFENLWTKPTYSSHLLQYIGYTFSGFLGIFIAPLIFYKLNMLALIGDGKEVQTYMK